jgi:hypothetical protein
VTDPSHRARVPNLINFSIRSGRISDSALDVERGIYFRRTVVQENIVLEQRWYAHRKFRNLLVYELYPVQPLQKPVSICLDQNYGKPSTDILFKQRNTTSYNSWLGTTQIPETQSYSLTGVIVVYSNASLCFDLQNTKFTYLVVTNTTLDANIPLDLLLSGTVPNYAKYKFLSEVPSTLYNSIPFGNSLLDSHITEWANVWRSGIEVETVDDNHLLPRSINTSLYYILGSIRQDWEYSLSPGSLSSDDYHGHVFWDCETWMVCGCLLYYYHSNICDKYSIHLY